MSIRNKANTIIIDLFAEIIEIYPMRISMEYFNMGDLKYNINGRKAIMAKLKSRDLMDKLELIEMKDPIMEGNIKIKVIISDLSVTYNCLPKYRPKDKAKGIKAIVRKPYIKFS